MGTIRLCEHTIAEHPFYHEMIGVHLYSLEELCYYMETHYYLIDKSWIAEPLFVWIANDLGMEELGSRLHSILFKTKDIFDCVGEIFRASGAYSVKEYSDIMNLLEGLRGKTPMERRKVRGDLMLFSGKYRQAAYIYQELLEDNNARQMTEELKGNILHNLGVVYARMFQFEEAAYMFASSYKLTHSDKTRMAYLYAMNYVEDTFPMDEQEMELNFNIMREALSAFTERTDDPEYYIERKLASQAANAFDWKSKRTELLNHWKEKYTAIN